MHITCCKDCPNRFLGCHDTCKIYIAQHKKLIQESHAKQKFLERSYAVSERLERDSRD